MVESALLEQVLRLPAEDRQELIYELADSLANEEPLSPEMRVLLDERLADVAARPGAHRPWNEVRQELFGRYRS